MKEYSFGICPYRIRNYKTEILLGQATGRTDWGFIKGKIEDGETPEQCAVRECLEETGIVVKEEHLEDKFLNKNKRKDIEIFLADEVNCDFSNIRLQPEEIQDIKWFNIDSDINIQHNQKRILHEIVSKFIKRQYRFKEKE